MKTGAPRLDRRQLLGGGLAVTSLAAWPVAAPAASGDLPQAGRASILLLDERLATPDDLPQGLLSRDTRVVPLQGDPVRLWRDALCASLQQPDARLLGITRWPDLLIFRGLAQEARRHLRQQRFEAASGGFIWLIA